MNRERPKVKVQNISRILDDLSIEYTNRVPHFAIVIGGDGVFSYFGRIKSIPLLFVGVRSNKVTGSRAYLAETYLNELKQTLTKIKLGKYRILEYKRLEVLINGERIGEVFTDIYLERGADSNCLRYKLIARGDDFSFTDFAIANGVVICTSAGSTGYYSYLDKVRSNGKLKPDKNTIIKNDEIGICHIVPIYTKRESSSENPLRYTIPWGSEMKIQLMRDADARLYGVTKSKKGIKITTEDVIIIKSSSNTTKVVKLDQ
jgi:NAD+ kinase